MGQSLRELTTQLKIAILRRNASVSVWWDDARNRRLPPVCALSGQSSAAYGQFSDLSVPARVWLLVLLLPLFLLGGIPAPDRSIQLPLSTQWRQRLRATSGTSLLLIPVTVALIFAAVNGWFGLRFLFAALAAAAFATSMTLAVMRESWQPRYGAPTKDASGRLYIRLRSVHPAFAHAVEQQYRAAGQPMIAAE